MTGEEFLRLQESNVFRPDVMDSTINEFVPSGDAFKITDAFLPFKNLNKNKVLTLIKHGQFGKTSPVNLGADHKRIGMTGYGYKEQTAGHWREAVAFNEAVLQEAIDPASPQSRWGQGMVEDALNLLDLRLNNLIEFLSKEIVVNGTYSESRFGVNYTYDPKIPAKFFKNVTSTPGWTTGGTWGTYGSSTPVADVRGAKRKMQDYGFEPTAVWMNGNTLHDFNQSSDTQATIANSPALIANSADPRAIFNTLTGLVVMEDNRVYREESRLTAASAINDTTFNVEDSGFFTAGEVVTLYNSLGEEEDLTVASSAANVVTVTTGCTLAYAAGDRMTVAKKFLPDNDFIIQTAGNQRSAPNNWISTPSLIKGSSWTNPLPGRYTWTNFNAKVPYTLEVGAGIDGGPSVAACNWMRVRTK